VTLRLAPQEIKFRSWLWALLVAYTLARVSQAFPTKIPLLAIVAAHVIPPLMFALVHGGAVYGVEGILVFVLCCALFGNALENLSILTGFPFGHYHFTNVMGPRFLQVPILLGLAYIGMGYVSWTVARLILGDADKPLKGSRVITRPLAATFVMVAWDLSMDPVWSNLAHAWTWHDGGAYFGVPVTNFLGWYLTVYLIYQSFAIWICHRCTPRSLPRPDWLIVVLFYTVAALGNLLVIPPAAMPVVTDSAATPWHVSSILNSSALISLFVMGAFAAFAWVRTWEG
jgi:uncharacterized membrane protein